MFSRKFIQFIKKNFTYTEYLDNLGVPSLPTNRPDEMRICCPRCGETDFKLYVNDEKKTFCCFKCDFGHFGNGDVFNLVAELEGISAGVAMSRLCADYRSVTPDDIIFTDEPDLVIPSKSFETVKVLSSLPPGSTKITEINDESRPFVEYLQERGFTFQDILTLQTHYTHPHSFTKVTQGNGDVSKVKLKDRVIWPIYGGAGDLVSWLARTVSSTPTKQKYIVCPNSEIAKTFWPFIPLVPGTTEAVLCEGLIDAFSVRRAGYASYATFGKKLSEEQVTLLKHWGVDTLTIMFDADAKQSVVNIVESLKLKFNKIYVVDVSSWENIDPPNKIDAGYLMKRSDGIDLIRSAMNARIDCSDEWAFLKWRIK